MAAWFLFQPKLLLRNVQEQQHCSSNQLSLSLNAATTGVHGSALARQTKQEAQSNPCPTQGLSLGSRGTRGTALWFAHLSLSLSHTNRNTTRLQTAPQHTSKTGITPSAYLNSCIYLHHSPLAKKSQWEKRKLPKLYPLLAQISLLLYHADSGDSLTCCERVNHRESDARLAVVLQVMEILLVLSGQVEDTERVSRSSWLPQRAE